MNESEKIDLLVELFGWVDEPQWRFEALRVLRRARNEPYPTYDDFVAEVPR